MSILRECSVSGKPERPRIFYSLPSLWGKHDGMRNRRGRQGTLEYSRSECERHMIEFVLPFALESLNVRDRKHWTDRARSKANMNLEVMAALGGPRYFPRPPLGRVRVTVVRCSSGRLDRDNLYASFKSLGDVLCIRSPRNPYGLGIVTDDTADLLELVMSQSPAAPGKGSSIVRIEELPANATTAGSPLENQRPTLACGSIVSPDSRSSYRRRRS